MTQGEHLPIQISAVIVLGAQNGPALAPPSPPTPCISPPYDASLCKPADAFRLAVGQGAAPRRGDSRVSRGLHVLNVEATALAKLAALYETDAVARDGFEEAAQVITMQRAAHGKVVVIGVGKSGHIGKKAVATLRSLAIPAVFLHPTEALHGDLGIIGPHDMLFFITYSGKTQELLLLLPHLDPALRTIVLTSHTRREQCELLSHRPDAILLPAPIPESETQSFGVPAPSTSTTVALALCDALAITVAGELHQNLPSEFARNHPGGAIGASTANRPALLGHIATPWREIGEAAGLSSDSLGVDLLRAGYHSRTGWVRVEEAVAPPGKIRQLSSADLCVPLRSMADVLVAPGSMIHLPSDTTVREAGDMLRMLRPTPGEGEEGAEEEEDGKAWPRLGDAVVAITEGGNLVGILEAARILEQAA